MQPYYLSLDTTQPHDYEPPETGGWGYMTLTEIADLYRTDKGTLKHNYTQVYERYFSKLRSCQYIAEGSSFNLLEIGVACGASLKMWSRYFESAQITGCDINPLCASLCKDYENINIVIQDAARQTVKGSWDIIIDDGSHVALDIREAFLGHWPMLKPGGYYCIEDTGCTLPSRNYDRPRRLKGEREREEYDRFISSLTAVTDMGGEIEFVHMYKELVIIKKLPNPPANGRD